MSSQFEDEAATYKQHTILGYSKSVFLGAELHCVMCTPVCGLSLNLTVILQDTGYSPHFPGEGRNRDSGMNPTSKQGSEP